MSVGALVLERTETLAAVPAPTFAEARRAEIVAGWWEEDGITPHSDDAGNVRGRLRAGIGPAVMVCAHLDTVFPASVDHHPRREGGRLCGPGVGDDTVAVAALSALDRALPAAVGAPVWIAATVAEEGLGNLAGALHLVAHPPAEIGWLIAVEGNYLGRVVTRGVGSVRWRIELDGPGGHAWEAAQAPSAVHALGALIAALDPLTVPGPAERRRTVNVGRAGGGEAINARAAAAWCEVDVRSADAADLARLEEEVAADAAGAAGDRVELRWQEIGRRPAGAIPADHPLVEAAVTALRRAGREPELGAASTDANAAHAAGIPAVTLGITTGAGEHTPEEWIDVEPIEEGVTVLADTIVTLTGAGR